MTSSVGINGFGRMGRLGVRAAWGREDFGVTRVNEIATDAVGSAHLLKFDSVHGVWPVDCSGEGEAMRVAGEQIAYTANSTIADTDWSDCDIVIEATGRHHKTPQSLQAYFDQGVQKVVVAAPTEGALNIVYGINHQLYDSQRHHLVTAASCTTNCLAPVVQVMHEKIGIVHGCMTTIHDITNTQTIVDKGHKDLRRARLRSIAGPDHDGFSQGHHQDIPVAGREAERPCGACAPAERLPDRLRIRGRKTGDCRRGQ